MTWIQSSTPEPQSFGFVAPEGVSTPVNEVLFPFHEKQNPKYAATLAVAVKQFTTVLVPGKLTGNATINLTIDKQVTPGAKLLLKLEADATERTVTLGTGFDAAAAAITVTEETTAFRTFFFDGTAFVPSN